MYDVVMKLQNTHLEAPEVARPVGRVAQRDLVEHDFECLLYATIIYTPPPINVYSVYLNNVF